MKKQLYTFFGLFGIIGFSACEQVVQLNVDSDEPILIINSQISNELKNWEVHLSLTQGYFDQSDLTSVSDAEVIIQDSDGVSDTLNHTVDGLFVSKVPKACVIGKSYTLTVKHNDQVYTASEECFYQDTIQFIRSYYLPEQNGFIPEGYYVFEKAEENEPDGDFYLWRIYQNGIDLVDSIGFLYDDDEFRSTGFFNIEVDPDDPLKDIDRGVYPRPFPWNFEKGDLVRVEQMRISEEYYNFIDGFATQQQIAGTPFDPPPANPRSNIQGGAYGFFSVVNMSAASVVVTD